MDVQFPDWDQDGVYDGGDKGCGMLVLDLARHFRQLPAGARVVVRALDSGAPLDLPAWCRSTGHALIRSEHPFYFIERSRS